MNAGMPRRGVCVCMYVRTVVCGGFSFPGSAALKKFHLL